MNEVITVLVILQMEVREKKSRQEEEELKKKKGKEKEEEERKRLLEEEEQEKLRKEACKEAERVLGIVDQSRSDDHLSSVSCELFRDYNHSD